MNVDPKDANRGVYKKFVVERADGSSAEGGKHEGCEYFVIDLTHDPHAAAALEAYAASCKDEYPKLADDLTMVALGCRLRLIDAWHHESGPLAVQMAWREQYEESLRRALEASDD